MNRSHLLNSPLSLLFVMVISYGLFLLVLVPVIGSSPTSPSPSLPDEIRGKPEADLWVGWKEQFEKEYSSEAEEIERFTIWVDNLHKVQQHNSATSSENSKSFRLGMNEFADMTQQDFLNSQLGHKDPSETESLEDGSETNYGGGGLEGDVPSEIDWRDSGYVSGVKYQNHCGSCWAFSAAGSLEGQYFNRTGVLIELSAQQMVDCVMGSYGCGGGNVELAFYYLMATGSISAEDYPYKATDTQACMDEGKRIVTNVTFYNRLPKGNETALKEAVGLIGPVSAAMDASHFSFQFYERGVFYEPLCNPNSLDHSVLIVGYGTTPEGEDYWLVKNSWGANWGLDGYFMLARNRDNHCGIASYTGYPTI